MKTFKNYYFYQDQINLLVNLLANKRASDE